MKDNLTPCSIFDPAFNGDSIGWCSPDNIGQLFKLDRGTVFVSEVGSLRYIPLARKTRLELELVENPREAFNEYIKDFKQMNETYISPSAVIGKNTVIHEGTFIGDNVIIGDNCTIGGDGFGYENGKKINHLGRVYISNGAHIGNNVCIDRAALGSTFIAEDVKIDNLVHIAHGASIGERSMIIAGAVVCGSVVIGSDCWIAPNASIHQKVKIGNHVTVGLGAVALKDIESGAIVAGVPAKRIGTKLI